MDLFSVRESSIALGANNKAPVGDVNAVDDNKFVGYEMSNDEVIIQFDNFHNFK